jgi:hypothetical protein
MTTPSSAAPVGLDSSGRIAPGQEAARQAVVIPV